MAGSFLKPGSGFFSSSLLVLLSCIMAARVLSGYIAIKGDNGMYLTLDMQGTTPYLTFSAEKKTRLAVHHVLYNSTDGTVVIRAANGRFWRRNSEAFIVADVEEYPDSANLDARFKVVDLDSGTHGFQSAQDNLFLNRFYTQSGYSNYKALEEKANQWTVVEVSDAKDYALFLPSYLSFMGDNNQLIQLYYERDHAWQKFNGGSSPSLVSSYQVIPLVDGSVAVMSAKNGLYWRRSPNWIWADTTAENALASDNLDCHFEPVRLSTSMVALKSMANGKFLKRLTDYWESCLNAAGDDTNDDTTRLCLQEPVGKRTVFNVVYLLELAQMTQVTPMIVGKGSVSNNTTCDATFTVHVEISTTVTTFSNFTNTYTFSEKVSTEFEAGIPFVGDAKVGIEIGAEQSFATNWGTSTETTLSFQTEYQVTVPAGKTVTVAVECTTAKLQIPFTYDEKIVDSEGIEHPAEHRIDGFFEGVSAYNIQAVISSNDNAQNKVVPALK